MTEPRQSEFWASDGPPARVPNKSADVLIAKGCGKKPCCSGVVSFVYHWYESRAKGSVSFRELCLLFSASFLRNDSGSSESESEDCDIVVFVVFVLKCFVAADAEKAGYGIFR